MVSVEEDPREAITTFKIDTEEMIEATFMVNLYDLASPSKEAAFNIIICWRIVYLEVTWEGLEAGEGEEGQEEIIIMVIEEEL